MYFPGWHEPSQGPPTSKPAPAVGRPCEGPLQVATNLVDAPVPEVTKTASATPRRDALERSGRTFNGHAVDLHEAVQHGPVGGPEVADQAASAIVEEKDEGGMREELALATPWTYTQRHNTDWLESQWSQTRLQPQ